MNALSDISQGNVATYVRRGKKCKILLQFLLSATVENSEKWPTFGKVMNENYRVCVCVLHTGQMYFFG